jgi:hypothetical protein
MDRTAGGQARGTGIEGGVPCLWEQADRFGAADTFGQERGTMKGGRKRSSDLRIDLCTPSQSRSSRQEERYEEQV